MLFNFLSSGNTFIHIGVICLLTLVVYFKTIFYHLVVDDLPRYEGEEKRKKGETSKEKALPFWWPHSYNTKIDHIISILLHMMVCTLIYSVFGMNCASLFAALLFAVNPITHQGAVWLSGRGYVLSTILVLLTYPFLPFSLILYPVLVHVCHNTVFYPLLLVSTPYWYIPFLFTPFLLSSKIRAQLYSRVAPIIQEKFKQFPQGEMLTIKPAKIILFVKTYAYYFIRTFVPLRIGMYPDYLLYFGASKEGNQDGYKLNWRFWAGLTILLANITLIILFWNTPISLGLIWFTILVSKYCNIITISQTVVDRYTYLASIGLMVVLGYMLTLLPTIVAVTLFTSLLTFYLTKLSTGMVQYKDWPTFMKYHIYNYPDSPYAYIFISNTALANKQYARAFIICQDGLLHCPADFKLNYNMGVSCLFNKQLPLAVKHFSIALNNPIPGWEEKITNDLAPVISAIQDHINDPSKPLRQLKFKLC